jgi:nucleoside-diphosphate-sugar epimerase
VSEAEPAYLITGATGFLGRHILEALRRATPRARVVALLRDPSTWSSESWTREFPDVALVTGTLFDADRWKNHPALENIDGIFHLAAIVKHSRQAPEEMIRVNVEGTANMVHLAADKKCRMVFASSSGVVGCSKDVRAAPDESAAYCEHVVSGWPYYASKIQAEKRARALADQLHVELVVIRPPVMLGPGDHRFRSTSNVLRLLEGRLPFILEGEMHFVDIRDVADATVRAMTIASPRPAYNLPGHEMSLDEFFRRAASAAGITPKWKTLPGKLLWYAAKANELTGRRLHVLPDPVVIEMARHHWGISSRYAETDLGFRSRPGDETLRDTVAWLRNARAA